MIRQSLRIAAFSCLGYFGFVFLWSWMMEPESVTKLVASFLTGWFSYGHEALHEPTGNWRWLLRLVAWVAATVLGLFLVARAIRRPSDSSGKRISLTHATAATLILLSPFASAFIPVSIARNLVWILNLPKMNTLGRNANHKIINHGRELVLSCHLFAGDANGAYPATLQELVSAGIIDQDNFATLQRFPLLDGTTNQWIYLQGLNSGSPGDLPVIISPGQVYPDLYLVGFNSGSVEFITKKHYDEAMQRLRKFKAKPRKVWRKNDSMDYPPTAGPRTLSSWMLQKLPFAAPV